MSKLVLVLPRRQEPEEPLAAAPPGDLDLLPGAAILWVGSVARVVAGPPDGAVFQGEATLALICAVLIPCWALWSWIRFKMGADALKPPADGGSGIFTKS